MTETIALIIGGISSFVSAAALVFAAYTFKVNKSQLNFAVIVNCTERFQKIMPGIKSDDAAVKQRAIKQYIDLCNEELFYFKNGFLPQEVVDEWLDGMIYYLPHYVSEQSFRNKHEISELIAKENLSQEYPRVFSAFQFTDLYREHPKPTRPQLIFNVKKNLTKTAAIPNLPLPLIEDATNPPQLKE